MLQTPTNVLQQCPKFVLFTSPHLPPCSSSAHPSYYTSCFVSWYDANYVVLARTFYRQTDDFAYIECTLEDINDIIHHYVHAWQLGSHLERVTKNNPMQNTTFEKIGVGLGTFDLIILDLLLDSLQFKMNKFIILVSAAMEICEDLKCFFLTNNAI